MECNIIADGIVVFGMLTPWSDARSIVLAHEPAVVVGDAMVSEAYCQIVVELVTGDVIEIPESSPGWSHAVEQLPRHLPLLVDDIAGRIAAGVAEDVVLWHG